LTNPQSARGPKSQKSQISTIIKIKINTLSFPSKNDHYTQIFKIDNQKLILLVVDFWEGFLLIDFFDKKNKLILKQTKHDFS
jgi:hypothetical protein